ncbi:unnamed protein product, partial [Allacma fusca]
NKFQIKGTQLNGFCPFNNGISAKKFQLQMLINSCSSSMTNFDVWFKFNPMKDRLKGETMPLCQSEPAPVTHLPIKIQEESIYEDSMPILERVRPEWFRKMDGKGEGSQEDIQMRVFSGGITNKLVGFYLNSDKDDVVIVKMYGEKTEMFIDRDEEIKTMQLLHDRKCGPILYAIFDNGIAYEYTPGAPLNVINCRADTVYPLVAKEMARMHSIPLSPEEYEKGSSIWKLLKMFCKLSLEALDSKPEVKARFEAVGISNQWGLLAVEELEVLCSKEPMPLAFCHNDILLGNVILDEKRDVVAFIDFEYAATNYVPFDIANHFNEFAGGEDIDFSLYPDEEFQRAWIGQYLNHLKIGEGKSGYDVDTFYRWVQLCTPISLVLWMVWGIVQTCYSDIDYDFFTFVTVRLPEYNKAMQVIRLHNQNL